jgi:hypothetical protein
MKNPNVNENTAAYLEQLSRTMFWGSVTLKFEGGRIVHIRKEENLKPTDLSGTPRKVYETQYNTTRS